MHKPSDIVTKQSGFEIEKPEDEAPRMGPNRYKCTLYCVSSGVINSQNDVLESSYDQPQFYKP
jgi:hypothetical protein